MRAHGTYLEPVVPVSLKGIAHARNRSALSRPIPQVRVLAEQRGRQRFLLDRVRFRIRRTENLGLVDKELESLPRAARGKECSTHADARAERESAISYQ